MIGLRQKQEEARKKAEQKGQLGTENGNQENADNQMEVEPSDKPEEKPESLEQSGGRGRGRGAGRGVSIFGVRGAKGAAKTGRRLRPGEIRVQKDISELDGGECARAYFPDPNDLMNFYVVVAPDDGYWKGYEYRFDFKVPDMYPHEPPKVKCVDKIYHPNIDTEGNVCLNILRADWKPVLDINAVIYGLIVLFVQPNAEDPLNQQAAATMRRSKAEFASNVSRSLRGYTVDSVAYPPAKRAGTTK